MPAYIVSYRKFHNSTEPVSTNIVWAPSYAVVSDYFDKCDWFAAERAVEWQVKENRAKGMPEYDVYACPRCGHALHESCVDGYSFTCHECDEDFYRFEVI